MKVGVFIFATEYAIRIDELARELESRGYDSLFVPEHTHIPTSRRSPWPGGAPLPKEYIHTLDPFVGLTAAASVTTKLRIGTGICLMSQRDPIVTAKAAASLDYLSNGRFDFAVGAGWNAEEMENHGTVFETRFRVMAERIRAMKTIWTEEEAEFHGEFVDFDPIWSYPKPVQKPHPPLLLGGETKYTMKRIVDFADGWFPRPRGFDPAEGMAHLAQIAAEADRDMSTISCTVFGAKPDRETLDRYANAGIDRVLFGLPPAGRDVVLPKLDAYAKLIE